MSARPHVLPPDNTSEFDTALDDAIAQLRAGAPVERCLSAHPEIAEDLRPLLEMAQFTLDAAVVTPPPGAKARVRGRVLAAAETRLGHRPWWELGWLRGGRALRANPAGLAAAGAAALLALGSGGAVVASASALPGEPLYPVKLATEDARVTVVRAVGDPEAQAQLHAELAGRRVAEIKALADQGKPIPPGVVEAAVQQADAADASAAQLPEPKRAQTAAKLDAAQEQRTTTLASVQAQVAPPARAAIAQAMEQDHGNRGNSGERKGGPRESLAATAATTTPAPASTLQGAGPAVTGAQPAAVAPSVTPAIRESDEGKGNGDHEGDRGVNQSANQSTNQGANRGAGQDTGQGVGQGPSQNANQNAGQQGNQGVSQSSNPGNPSNSGNPGVDQRGGPPGLNRGAQSDGGRGEDGPPSTSSSSTSSLGSNGRGNASDNRGVDGRGGRGNGEDRGAEGPSVPATAPAANAAPAITPSVNAAPASTATTTAPGARDAVLAVATAVSSASLSTGETGGRGNGNQSSGNQGNGAAGDNGSPPTLPRQDGGNQGQGRGQEERRGADEAPSGTPVPTTPTAPTQTAAPPTPTSDPTPRATASSVATERPTAARGDDGTGGRGASREDGDRTDRGSGNGSANGGNAGTSGNAGNGATGAGRRQP